MRIAQIIPGTGNFLCGTCLREHAVARGLRKLGHEVLIVPLYLPLVLEDGPDEPASDHPPPPMFFGGINVYLQQKSALFRHTPRWFDRMLDAPPLLRTLADRSGATHASDLGVMTVSMLRGEHGRQRKELDHLCDWLAREGRPDVVCLGTGLLTGLAGRIRARTGAAVVCTLQGEDAFLDALPAPHRERAWAELSRRAEDVDLFVPVSHTYGRIMSRRLELPDDRVRVIQNGIDTAGFEPGPAPAPPVVGFLARLGPAKGLDTLAEAYLQLRERGSVPGVRLHVGGAATRTDRPFLARLRSTFARRGAAADLEVRPNLDRARKLAFLRSLSVLSVPATYGEAFGLYVLEALACGVPVVQPRHGAFPEVLAATGGGRLCEPDDPAALADGLEHVLTRLDEARSDARRARDTVRSHFSAERMAGEMAEACAKVRTGSRT